MKPVRQDRLGATFALLLVLGILPGCARLWGTELKEVYIGLGKGGAATLDVPQVSGQVTGPFVYHSVPVGAVPKEPNAPPPEE